MKTPLVKSILFFLLILLFEDCRKKEYGCADMVVTYTNLEVTSLNKTRYFTDPSFDTVKFKSSNGDTLMFLKTSTDSTWFDSYLSFGSPECGPYQNDKYLEITNHYSTIKGEGTFQVKHSRRTRTDYYGNIGINKIIEIWFWNNHFYFFEEDFGRKDWTYYIGDLSIGNKTFQDVFYTIANYNVNSGVKAFFAPNVGIIQITDTINNIQYETLN